MKRFFKLGLTRFCLPLIVALAVGLPGALPIQASSALAPAAVDTSDLLPVAPPALPVIPSLPLVHVQIPARTGGTALTAPTGGHGTLLFKALPGSGVADTAAQACTSTSIDLKVLIIEADPTDAQTAAPAIRQALDYQGTPYTVFIASPRPTDPNANRLATLLSSGCHANFEGVILGNGEVAYSDPTAGWQSALTTPEWQSLYSFERTFGVRQVTWYTFPTANYGFNAPSSSGDTTASPISASYTAAGQPVYSYANTANPLTITNVWAYKATPLDSNTSALLSDGSGNALVAVKTYPDGTQNLAMTFDGNPNLVHTQVVAYGAVNWVTKGLFLGERHIFMVPQEDDIFIDDHVWTEGTPCGTNPETTKQLYRITGDDLQAFINWQTGIQSQPTTRGFKLAHAFVGQGTTGIYSPDTLTPKAQATQGVFSWVNHTYTHANLDNASYSTMMSEITQNIQIAQQMGFTTFNTKNLITPDISGLSNPNALQAMYDAGVRYVVSDTSRAGMNNPSPNIGIYNQYQPAILEIPRRPDNLFYNVTNPQQWTEEYNCFYASFWGHNLTYAELLDKESQVLVHYLLNGEMDPWMFHQPNLRAYDGTHTLLGDLTDATLAKYNALYSLPILTPTMDDLGGRMAGFMAYTSGGVTASIVPGQSITITAQNAAVVPVTGLNTSGAESYGGQPISHVSLSAGQTVTISLSSNRPPTAANDSYTAAKNATLIVPAPGVLGNDTDSDGDALTASLVTGPANGTLTLNANGSFSYTPTANFTGSDSFTYRATDPSGAQSNVATVNILVKNTAPVANNDSYAMHGLDVLLSVPAPGVLTNDTDANGDKLTVVLVAGPSHGTLSLNPDGSFIYAPLPSLTSFTDSFTYKVFDGTDYSNVATVTIQVTEP